MSRKGQLAVLAIVMGLSVTFGTLLGAIVKTPPPRTAQPEVLLASAPTVAMPAALPLTQSVPAPSFADIAERAIPSVVGIQATEFTRGSRRQVPMDPFHFFFGQPEEQEGDESEEQDEGQREDGAGSGFLIRKDGWILTNYHVVARASKVMVTLAGDERYPAEIKGKDQSIDVALLKIEAPRDLPVLPLGDSRSLRVGEWVLAIGNPVGLEHSVTIGVVSAKGRGLGGLNPDRGLANYIQTDAAINFGNSGGPLLNARGEVIGVNTAITRSYGQYPGIVQGIGFALPIDTAKAVLDQLMTTGKVSRGYLSIQIEAVDEAKRKFYGLSERKGAFVQKVNEDGPAARAGVKNGDVIVSVDGQPVDNTESLIQMVSSNRPGNTITLGLVRCREAGGEGCSPQDIAVKVKLADRAESVVASSEGAESGRGNGEQERPASVARLGFTVSELTAASFNEVYEGRLKLPARHVEGVLVTRVSNQGAAFEAGLQPGQIVTQVGRERITSIEDFRRAAEKIQKGQVVRLGVSFYLPGQRGGDPQEETRYIFFEAE